MRPTSKSPCRDRRGPAGPAAGMGMGMGGGTGTGGGAGVDEPGSSEPR